MSEDKKQRLISGAESPLHKVFSTDYDFVIPSYQRPYAWGVDQASELFDDLWDFHKREKLDGYFLGSIVLIKNEGLSHAEVVDGQQRLTTLTILLSCIANKLSGKLRDNMDKYIREPGEPLRGIEPKPRLALRDLDRAFFEKTVQSLALDELLAMDSAQLENESQKNIKANAKLLLERIQKYAGDSEDSLKEFTAFLLNRCFLVVVSTPSQQSAFRVFSVLNSRGLDLLPTDIIKADVIGALPDADRATYTQKWEECEIDTGRNGFADLFGHIRMIAAKEKAKRALLEEFRESVLSKQTSKQDFIDKLIVPYADAYSTLKQCNYEAVKNSEEINHLLTWLNRIENSDWIPPAIKVLDQKKADPDYILWFFKKLERLAAFMQICGYNVNERIERYAMLLKGLETEHSLSNPPMGIELTDNEKKKFKVEIEGNVYEMSPKRRGYLMLRVDSFQADGAASYKHDLLTIEHVLPQTIHPESDWAKTWPNTVDRVKWVHRLANLVPLTRKRNSSAQNFDFDKKKSTYFSGSKGVTTYTLTAQVLKEPKWTLDVVEKRQTTLLKMIHECWEL